MQLAHGAPAQALLQAVDQPGEFLGRGGCLGVVSKTRLRVGAVRDDQPVLALGQVLGHQHVQGGGLEAEVRLQLAAQAM